MIETGCLRGGNCDSRHHDHMLIDLLLPCMVNNSAQKNVNL